MLKQLDFISARGDVLPLANNEYFILSNIDGQTIAETDISTVTISGIDGDTVNNVQATPRGIVLDLYVRSGVDVEEAKRHILKVVKLKQRGKLLWTQNGRTVVISGIVEAIDMPRWTNQTVMQITLYCNQPFWEDVDDIVQQINEAINLHYFTSDPADMLYFPESGIPLGEYDTIRVKSFHNAGDVAVGVEITIVAHDTVTNPIIYDQDGNYFGIGYEETYTNEDDDGNLTSSVVRNPFVMRTGDVVVITTHKGNKTVLYNGTPIFDKIKPRSAWLQLAAGDNQFSIDSDDDNVANMAFSIKYKQRYI